MKPPYSVVIASARADRGLESVAALLRLPAAERPAEIIVCVGRNPSRQRNLGVALCQSPLVYFLDDDSRTVAATPRRLAAHFRDPRTAVAGGPNLHPPGATPFERTVSAVLASWLGSFKVRSRYASVGSLREATEKDLILCNLMVRRSTFQKLGGFRVDLYPNEENEFLNRLLHGGAQLLYDPGAVVYRHRRKNLGAFCHQAFRYGQGRARQIKVYPCLSDLVHLIPAFFVLYTLSLAAAAFPAAPAFLRTPFWWAPFALFWALALGTSLSAFSWNRQIWDIGAVPVLIFLRQFFYGVGLAAGFLRPSPPASQAPAAAYRVKARGTSYRLVPVKRPKGG
ncbi:MAG TPA: glycosyltransferase family 2 protein [bacterium]|nr:glycosyltransferase family 2 protein [bacterium]